MGISARHISIVVASALAATAPCLAQGDIQSMSLFPPSHPLNTGAFEPFTAGSFVFVDRGNGLATCEFFESAPWAPPEDRMVSVPNTVPSPGAIALAAAALVTLGGPRRRKAI